MQANHKHAAACQPAASRGRRLHLKCKAASTATATKAPVKVLLKIPYRVNFGQTVAVLGTGELLGHWEPTKAVKMQWAVGDFWEAEISVEPGSATQLEYKYVVLNANGTVSHWKPGQNYKLDVLAARGTRVLVTETWDDGPRHVEVDMENADPPPPAAAAASTSAAAQQPQAHSGNGNGNGNGHASSNGAAAPSGNGKSAPAEASAAPSKNGKHAPSSNGSNGSSNGSSLPQAAAQEARAVAAASAGPLSGTAVIQQEAQAAMSELKDALDRQVNTLQRVADPTAIEVLIGDRLLAAANSKAVALNRAVRAAEALPMLPPGVDVNARSASPPPPGAKEPASKQQQKRA